ncbi:MAG: hypothetical protein CMH48_08180 [Muricauda sp.]|nr:HAD family hydrolase [Allomuricauda sp.]MBC30810.1 hypothetical protein [Allomuricauda sp.]|tara:strand:- start:354 stop:2420 length:2067 start_codon:yes stop_codon:yes gene_type:complete
MFNRLFSELSSIKECQVVFFDFFDTIAIRGVDPNYVLRIWSKLMIRELGLDLRIDELYLIRKESERYLAEEMGKNPVAIPYEKVIEEVFNRLTCTNNLTAIDRTAFAGYFKNSDYRAETLFQTPGEKMFEVFRQLKEKGYKMYCVSDFYGSSALLQKFLSYHGLENIFDGLYVSSDCGHSKQTGDMYAHLLAKLGLRAEQVAVIGSSKKQNLPTAQKEGIRTIQVPAKKLGVGNKRMPNGYDQKKYRKIVRELYRKCNRKPAPPHSDYILFYYVYIERLYRKAKKDNIKNIFFLAREGLFLKKLFDHYQNEISINEEDKITAHYFKASRNSLMLASFKGLEVEEFSYLKRRWPALSVDSFLKNFNLPQDVADDIVKSAGLEQERDKVLKDFLYSETFKRLKENDRFVEAYDNTRNEQKRYFEAYLNSFDVDIKSEGIHLADVGWGGTMQNRLYDFFEEKVKVHGYYLGVREVNNIREDTKKYGLNFSVYPYITFFDHILMGNVELNEQLLAAGHGSTVAYTDESNSYTIEHHEENDKRVYEKYIEETQNFMFERFEELTRRFERVCYDYDLEQYEMMDHALRIGLFARKRKVAREVNIYKGFYQNVGNFSVGLAIGENFGKKQKIELLKNFFLYPEKAFRYVLRFKPMLMRRKKYFLAYFIPTFLIYRYIKLRCHIKGLTPKRSEYLY